MNLKISSKDGLSQVDLHLQVVKRNVAVCSIMEGLSAVAIH